MRFLNRHTCSVNWLMGAYMTVTYSQHYCCVINVHIHIKLCMEHVHSVLSPVHVYQIHTTTGYAAKWRVVCSSIHHTLCDT